MDNSKENEVISSILVNKKSSYIGDVVKLASGTVAGQALLVMTAPILTRLYTPESFGVYAMFTSICSILTVVSSLRYEMAIMLPEKDEEAVNLVVGTFGIIIINSLLISVFLWFGGPLIENILKSPEIGTYLWLVAIYLLFGGTSIMHQGLNFWASRKKLFGLIGWSRILNYLALVIIQVGFGLLGYATSGTLILGSIAGGIVSSLLVGIYIYRNDKGLFFRNVNMGSILTGLKKYRKFPQFETLGILLNTISWQLPTFLLAFYFSPVIVGYYALCSRLLKLPMSLIGGAIAQVFYQRAAQAKLENRLAGMVEQTFHVLVDLGMFPLLLLTIIGPNLFMILFGANWKEAGIYAQILGVWIFIWFLSSPLYTIFNILEKQEQGLIINSVIFITRLISLIVGGYLGNARLALLLFAISGIFVYGYLNFKVMVEANVSFRRAFRILFDNFLLFIPAGLFLGIISIIKVQPWFQLSSAGVCLFLYYYFQWTRNPAFRDFVSNLKISRRLI